MENLITLAEKEKKIAELENQIKNLADKLLEQEKAMVEE